MSLWELLLVLEALVSNTCTALKQFSPRALSLKTVELAALIFAERAGKLIVLSVSPCCTCLCRSEASGKSPYSSVALKMMQRSTRSRAIQMISSAPFTLRSGANFTFRGRFLSWQATLKHTQSSSHFASSWSPASWTAERSKTHFTGWLGECASRAHGQVVCQVLATTSRPGVADDPVE